MTFYDVCTEFFSDREEVSAAAFYRELFPKGELQRRDINQAEQGSKWNGRKSVQEKVIEFLNENPEAAYQEFCERTGLKKSVYYKYKKEWQLKQNEEYQAYRNRFAIASIFDNCVKDAETGESVNLADLITGVPVPKEPLSFGLK